MKEVFGDAMVLRRNYTYLCVTTNGFVKKNGEAVMGAGIAKTVNLLSHKHGMNAAARLGRLITKNGNVVQRIFKNVIAFPVKHNWWEAADIELIKESCRQLVSLLGPDETALLPRPGCGNGKLNWSDVKPVIEKILDDRVSIVHWKEEGKGVMK